jgi:hypothetical protein
VHDRLVGIDDFSGEVNHAVGEAENVPSYSLSKRDGLVVSMLRHCQAMALPGI